MNFTQQQKMVYTNPALAKSSVGIGLPVNIGVNYTPTTVCVFFIAKNSIISTPVKGVPMMSCVGVSQDTLFPMYSKTNPAQLITSFDWSLIGDAKLSSTLEPSKMTTQSIATLVAIKNISFENIQVSFTHDAYLNATQIASRFGKQVRDYLKSERTQEYIQALIENLSEKRNLLTQNDLVIIKKGNSRKYQQGTWLHPKLAIDFARWLNPKFAVWCDMQIEKILKGEYQPQNQELYKLFSGNLNYLMDYVKTLHNINTIAHSEGLDNQKNFAIEQIHSIIQYCNANNITTATGKPIFKDGQLNFAGGNCVVYNLPMLRLTGLVNY